mgnify:CR=1 FL=1
MANYRQMTSGQSFQALTACPTCVETFFVCYSPTSAVDVCCNLTNSVTVYGPAGSTFANATQIYSDSALSNVAPAGFYSEDSGSCGTP